jgi:hypothetical protein
MPSPHAVLIVDADPKGLEALVYGFQGAEWRITACPSPETATLLVKASGAGIVVVASRSEHEKAHSLLRQLRAKEAFRTLPVLALGPEELRQPLKETGEADLLPLPAFVRDVLTASELLVAAGTAAAEKTREEPCYRSPVTSSKTLAVVRSMNGLARSGHLRLERNGRAGEIMFHEGELTAASVGPLQGMAAVQHLMIWNDGRLELRLRQVPRRRQLHQTANEFLEEMDRFQRDFAHAMKEIGPGSAVYSANQERLKQASGAVPAEVTPVVRLCNGNRALSDIIDESPFRVLDTVRILGRLAELGILTRSDGKPVVITAGEDFLDTARIVGLAPPSAWPMPAPIGGFPLSTPILRTPVPPTQPPQDEVKAPPPEPAKQSAPSGVAAAPPAGGSHTRHRTLEIGVPAAIAGTSAPAPIAAPAAQMPATAPAPAAHTPAAPAASTQAAPEHAAKESAPITPPSPFPLATVEPVVPVAAASAAAALATQSSGAVVPQSPSPLATIHPAGTVTQAAGVIDSRQHVRPTQPTVPAVGARRSVVIESIEAEDLRTPLPATPVAASAQAADPLASSASPITGELHVGPSRRTATQVIPTGRVSIQLDTSLASPPQAHGPQTPAAIVTKPEAPGTRVTGEMHVTSSGRTIHTTGKPATKSSSFHIDPSLSGEAPGTPKPAAPRRSDSRPVPLRRSDSRPTPGPKTRPSGSFSTVETDFFEREAELYKEEKVESFADLDDGKAKPGAKRGGKPGRPYRK